MGQNGGRSFEEFFAASYGRLVGLLYAFLHDRAQAEDVVQDALASALLRWPVVRGYHDPEAWVRKVAFRRAIDHQRRSARQLRVLLRLGPPPSLPPLPSEENDATRHDRHPRPRAAPAVARLRREHPGLSVEIVTVTRRALQQRSGLDIEVVVGTPQVHRAEAIRLGEYRLGMYASRAYLADHGMPSSIEELTQHQLVYFVDSMLQVDDLDAPRRLVPTMRDGLSSTNVFVHVEATRAGAGIGFLPCFMADRHSDLVRLLPSDFAELLPYWMVLRPDSMRRPAVAAVVQALREETEQRREELLGAK